MKDLEDKAFLPLDDEEKDLMESFERGEWQAVKNFEKEKEKLAAATAPKH